MARLGDPSQTAIDDLAAVMRALGGTRLVVLVLAVPSIFISGWPWWAVLILVPQLVFTMMLLFRWNRFATRFLRGWWLATEGLLCVVLIVAVGPKDVSDAIVVITLMVAACGVGLRPTGIVTAAANVVFVVLAVVGRVPDLPLATVDDWVRLIRLLVLTWAFVLAGWYLRSLSMERGRALRARAVLMEHEAAARERIRAAEEVHDGLTNMLEGGRMMASVLARGLANDPHGAPWSPLARRLSDALVEATATSRAVLRSLRADVPTDLAASCRLIAGKFSHEHPDVEVLTDLRDCNGDLAPLARFEIERALSELLGNVGRHSRAQSVHVSLGCDSTSVTLRVADDGVGLPPGWDVSAFEKAGHYGLAGLKERASRLGGSFDMSSTGQGTAVTLVFPAQIEVDVENAEAPCE